MSAVIMIMILIIIGFVVFSDYKKDQRKIQRVSQKQIESLHMTDEQRLEHELNIIGHEDKCPICRERK